MRVWTWLIIALLMVSSASAVSLTSSRAGCDNEVVLTLGVADLWDDSCSVFLGGRRFSGFAVSDEQSVTLEGFAGVGRYDSVIVACKRRSYQLPLSLDVTGHKCGFKFSTYHPPVVFELPPTLPPPPPPPPPPSSGGKHLLYEQYTEGGQQE